MEGAETTRMSADMASKPDMARQIGFFSATVVVIANMIGTGVFTTSGFVARDLAHPVPLLLCWVAGGIFALCGALCYGELGAQFPRAGGEYAYLKEAFGPLPAFLSGWVSLIVGFSAPIAASAIAFSVYFLKAFSLPSVTLLKVSLFGFDLAVISTETLMGVMAVVALSLVHMHSVRLGSRVQGTLDGFQGHRDRRFHCGRLPRGARLPLAFYRRFQGSLAL